MVAARPAVIGAFVLGGLAIATAAILFFGGGRLFERTTHAVVFFEGSVAGLDIGSPVTFRGVRVGSVERMALHLSADGVSRVPVYLELRPDQVIREGGDSSVGKAELERLVAAGLRAQLNTQSFVTGQFRVDLDFRPGTPATLVDADTGDVAQIPSIASDFERLRSTLSDVPVQEVAETALRTLAAVERLADRLDAELTPLLEASRQTVGSATRALDTTAESVARIEAEATRTMREVDALIADARRQLNGSGDALDRVLATAERVGRQAETLFVSINGLTGPRSQFRGDLEAGARDLAASASALRGFARAVERDPSIVLKGRDAR